MSQLLDTSVLVGIEQARLPAAVLRGDSGSVSVITVEELHLGARSATAEARSQRRATVEAVLSGFHLLAVDESVARACAEIRAAGRARGRRYQLADSLVGATARVHGLVLVTQDEGMRGMLGVDVEVV